MWGKKLRFTFKCSTGKEWGKLKWNIYIHANSQLLVKGWMGMKILKFGHHKEKANDSFSMGIINLDSWFTWTHKQPWTCPNFVPCLLALCLGIHVLNVFFFFFFFLPCLVKAGVPSKPGTPKRAENTQNSVQWEKAEDNGSNLTYYILESR